MTLENLLGISLERVEPDPSAIKRLLQAAQQNINGSKSTSISNEIRFDAAYKAIMQMANTALQCNGYRTLTSKPGHHLTMIQSLPKTIGVDTETLIVLDTLRKQRNATDYSGDLIPNSSLNECIDQAEKLWELLNDWIRKSYPHLI